MNKHQKLVQTQFLNDEEAVIRRLKQVYAQSHKDITGKIKGLDSSISALQAALKTVTDTDIGDLALAFLGKQAQHMTPDEAKETLQSMIQSKVYQKKYQQALEKQVGGVLDKLKKEQYSTISEYLTECYDNGYIGTMFDLQGQGIPLAIPMDQEAMVRAVQLDSKISKPLYTFLGENVDELKKKITAEVSRGISSGMTFQQVAQQLEGKTNIGYNRAVRIAHTEGHRIQCQAGMDACHDAKAKGADVLKQWDSTMDSRTRESHALVDGEVRELDEDFSNGLRFPGDPDGGAGEVINCRCALLQRARWALDDEELEALKQKAQAFGLDKSATFDDFKAKYIDAVKAPPAPPKKEYLTKKKLEQKIKDIDDQLKTATDPAVIQALEDQKADFQAKLDEKIVAAETKKLAKEKIQLQDQLDNYDIKTYSNIWKDDVTTLDWQDKKGAIPAKKSYFEGKLATATDPGDIAKWQGLLDDLDDFDSNGAAYFDIKKKLDDNAAALTKLQKNGKITQNIVDDAFSQDRKDAALWFDSAHGGFKAADKYFDPPSKAIHGAASTMEQNGFYTYTAGSGGHNRPLAGFRKPWSKLGSGWEEEFYVGPKQVWIDFEGKGDQIRGLTSLIQKSTYADDIWLQSGQGFQTIEGFLGIPYGTLSSMTDSQLQQFVGRRNVIYNFISTAVNEGGGAMFNEKPLKINFYAPKGSQMLYASDVGAFGKGENEMILQRGGTYEITRIYWGRDATDGNKRKIFVDMEIHPEAGYDLFQQDPKEWTGSKKNYQNS